MKSSPECEEELEKILQSVTPSNEIHQDYLDEVNGFVKEYNYFVSIAKAEGHKLPVKKFKLVDSHIFKRKYLVGYADNEWFRSFAPTFDAVASPSFSSFNLQSPPLVVVPESNSRSKNSKFLSILEHEFVHVNQAILNNFPETNSFSKKPINIMMSYALAEYQAYFIQYSHFPESHLEFKKYKFTIEYMAVLMGYTQSLERLVQAIYQGQLSATQVNKLLKDLPKNFPSEFEKIGINKSYGHEYAKNFAPYLSIAIQKILNFPAQPKNDGFTALTKWVSANFVS